ncbi:MAG: hypothetical protein K2G44_05095, partial [Clostridia bacterium]|nr:hypothetical protein [Clostridia bacterium]
PQDQFKTGSKNVLATATVDGKDGSTPITAEYDGGTHFDPSVIKVVGDDGITVTDYTVVYYKGKTPVAGNELAAGELPKDAGDYCIEIVLGPVAEAGYILGDDWFTVTVEAKGIALPELSEMTFNGNELNFVDYLTGESWTTYGPSGLDIIKVDGKLSDRNVGAGNYVTTLTITDPNYKWIYPAAKSAGVTGDEITATYNWNITPLVVDTTNMWNKGKAGATLNLPNNIRDFIAGGTLELGYRYYDSEGNFVEEPELKGGKSFKVEAVFSGDDAERNIVFKTGDNEFGSVSKGIDYTVPKNGAAVFFGSIGEFFENYWQPFVSGVCIVLSAIFAGLIGHFDSQRRKANKEAKQYKTGTQEPKQYKTAAVAATGLFGLAYATWTIIACVLIGLAVALFIGIFIAKARRNKAREALEAAKIEYAENKVVLAEQAKQDEADRLKKEQADEREEEKRRRDEEREEERRRREEERDEEKRRKEEEREEEKRRREEQREEERRRREEEREDERRRREDERRIAAMSNNNMGMGYGAMSPFAMQYAQPPVVQQQPMVMQPAQQPVQVVQPAQQVVASTDESKLEKAVEKLATELGHQKRVEGFLDMISKSREKDQAALAQSEKALEERKKKFEARRENMSAPFEPSVQRVYIPAMPANGNTREKELELELRAKEKELELEREKNKGEKTVQVQPTVAQQPVVQPAPQPAPQPVVQPVIQQVPVQVPVQTPVYPQPMYMPQGYMPSPYWQAPMPQGYAQPSYREYELERELERMRVRDYERMRNLEHELGIDRDRNFYVGQIKSNTPAQPYAQPALPQPQQVVMPQSYVQPQIPQSYTQATVRELELERDLREKERERTRELERELALEKERNRFAQEKPTVTAQPNTQPQPVVVVPPIVQTQPSEQQQQEIAQPAPARFLRRNNPFAANRFAEGNDD